MSQIKGKISQVIGPVVDVSFENADKLPNLLDAIEIKKDPNRAPDQSTNKKLGYEIPVPGGKGLMTLDVKGLLKQANPKDMNISPLTRSYINLGIYEKGRFAHKNEAVRKAVDELEKSIEKLKPQGSDNSEGSDSSEMAELPNSKELHKLYENFRSPPEMPPLQSERSLVWQTRASYGETAKVIELLKNRLELALSLKDSPVVHDIRTQIEKLEQSNV